MTYYEKGMEEKGLYIKNTIITNTWEDIKESGQNIKTTIHIYEDIEEKGMCNKTNILTNSTKKHKYYKYASLRRVTSHYL